LWATIPLALAAELGVGPYETDELLDLMRTGRDSEVIALFKEQPGATLRLNLRSSGRVDVGQIALALGGGGHAYAAGATLAGDLEAASKRVVTALIDAIARSRSLA
jgi:bifunctional oligoribonuclease and PAP phosphatase NrnA